jgi:alpha-beta hydrolase superfamily lysophospholipase
MRDSRSNSGIVPLDPERVVLTTADGVRLVADCFQPTGAGRAAVVLLHGFAGSCKQAELVGQAQALAEAGFSVLAPDTRGHGESGGLCTLGDDEQFDAAA